MMSEKQSYKPYIFVTIFLISLLLLLWTVYPFIYTIILSLMMVGVLHPAYQWLVKLSHGRVYGSSLLLCLLVFLGVFVPLVFLISTLSVEVADFYLYLRQSLTVGVVSQLMEQHAAWADKVQHLLQRFDVHLHYDFANFEEYVVVMGKTVGLIMYDQTRMLAGKVVDFTLHFVVMIVIVYYLLIDGTKLKEYILALLPMPRAQETLLLTKFNDMSIAIIIGNGTAAILQGIMGGIGLTMFGFRSPVLWGTVMAIFAFIPFIGISIVFVPITIYLFLSGQVARGIIFFIYFVLLSGIVEYIVKPKMVGDRVKMHVLLVFISIFGGIATYGILGILLGPLVAIAFLTLAEIYLSTMGRAFNQDE